MNVLTFLLYLLAFVFALLAAFAAPGRVSWLGLAVAFAVAPALIGSTHAL